MERPSSTGFLQLFFIGFLKAALGAGGFDDESV
jgi:hypothetical protein